MRRPDARSPGLARLAFVAALLPAGCLPSVTARYPCEVDAHCAGGNDYVCFEGQCTKKADVPPAPVDGGRDDDASGHDASGLDASAVDASRVDAGDDGGAVDASGDDASIVDGAAPDDAGGDGGADAGASDDDGGAGDAGDAGDAGPEPWWNVAFETRYPLTVDGSAVGGALSDVPVPVRLTPATVDYAKIAEDGADLRFVQDGALLPHEIESFVEDGESLVWVRLSSLPASGSATLHLYANGPVDDDEELVPSDVWSNGYEAVYHLHDEARDSSASALHGSFVGTATVVGGAFASARAFDGTARIDLGTDVPLLRATGEVTLSAFVRPDDVAAIGEQGIVGVTVGSAVPTSASRATLLIDGLTKHWEAGGRASDSEGLGEVIADVGPVEGALVHVAARIDYGASTVEIFVDGVRQTASGAVAFSQAQTPDTDAFTAGIGAEEDGSASFFIGVIDEVRIAREWRDDAWLRLEALSRAEGFVAIGPEEAL